MALAAYSPKEASEKGVSVEILDPTNNLPFKPFVRITVCGADSETFKKIHRKQINRRLEMSQNQQNHRKKTIITAAELEAEALDLLVGCTKAWRTGERAEIEFAEGEWLPCTPENVRRVYEELPWLREQIDQEIGDRSNFLPD